MADDDYKNRLTPQQYAVLRQGDTEAPFSGKLLNNKEQGTYKCAACGAELFGSETKYSSAPNEPNAGWPHFWKPTDEKNIKALDDSSHGMERTEVKCAVCDSHLGHVFTDSHTPSGQQYCINSCALDFKKS